MLSKVMFGKVMLGYILLGYITLAPLSKTVSDVKPYSVVFIDFVNTYQNIF